MLRSFSGRLRQASWGFLIAVICATAHAHKIKVWAEADGPVISGYVYFSGGGRPKNLRVVFLAPDGSTLGETVTGENGEFSFRAALRCDHRIVVETGDGHRGEWTVAAEELPESLPTLKAAGEAPTDSPDTPGPAEPAHTGPAPEAAGPEIAAIHRQIGACRRDIEKLTEKRRLQDILGGIGYIFGIAGIAFYLLGLRRKESQGNARPPQQ